MDKSSRITAALALVAVVALILLIVSIAPSADAVPWVKYSASGVFGASGGNNYNTRERCIIIPSGIVTLNACLSLITPPGVTLMAIPFGLGIAAIITCAVGACYLSYTARGSYFNGALNAKQSEGGKNGARRVYLYKAFAWTFSAAVITTATLVAFVVIVEANLVVTPPGTSSTYDAGFALCITAAVLMYSAAVGALAVRRRIAIAVSQVIELQSTLVQNS